MSILFRVVVALTLLSSCSLAKEPEKKIDPKVEKILDLMHNLGNVVKYSEREKGNKKSIVIRTDSGTILIEFSNDKSEELLSITRVDRKSQSGSLTWNIDRVKEQGIAYLKALFNKDINNDPILITQRNLVGLRELWSIGWARETDGYKMREDFMTVTFDEADGLFGFAYSQDSLAPKTFQKILCQKPKQLRRLRFKPRRLLRSFTLYIPLQIGFSELSTASDCRPQ